MVDLKKADFGGYATKNDLVCSDGLTIKGGAFAHNDRKKVPLVWHHQGADSPENVLGHAILENRADGVYAYGFFNQNELAQFAKEAVQHGDIDMLSIFANQLKKSGPRRMDVVHGEIREVSLVQAGANPGAFIDSVSFNHSDGSEFGEDEGVITLGDDGFIELIHADGSGDELEGDTKKVNLEHAETSTNKEGDTPVGDANEKTVGDIVDAFDEDQQAAVDIIVGEAIEADRAARGNTEGGDSAEHSDSGYGFYQDGFKHAMNLYDQNNQSNSDAGSSLSHEDVSKLLKTAARVGSLREVLGGAQGSSELTHADDYGITNIELMFPDARLATDAPELIARQTSWVPKVLGGVKKLPFAKVKSLTFDITGPEARAKGYVKGTRKTEEVLELLKRTTSPTTIYKKQKLDRDDILDITDFNVVVWMKWEIRFMLDEELARAILVGDGRSSGNADKIKDPAGNVDGIGIRSIRLDDELYAIKKEIAANTSNKNLIKEITRARVDYRGSGTPTLYTSDALLVDLLLEEDGFGRRLYETETALAAALRVKEIVPIEVFNEYPSLLGIIVNLVDYSIGTNKGGEVTFFEDFDIDFNQEKYLMETRLSGALTKPYSAIVITRDEGELTTANQPTFNPTTNTITIPVNANVNYTVDGEVVAAGALVITEDTTVQVEAKPGYYLGTGTTRSWSYTYED